MAVTKKQAKTSTAVGRKCSVCTHERVREINSSIGEGKPFRAISCQIQGNDSMRESVRRHTENCLKLEISALIKQKKIENAIDHYEEIGEQLRFAKDLRIAARAYLASPETGELTLIPRSSEVSVVYEDYADTKPNGEPKKKTDSLDVLLERVETGNVEPKRTIIKHVDIRSFALDAIRTTDIVLDKIAKLEGLYEKHNQQKNQQKPQSDEELARSLFEHLVKTVANVAQTPAEREHIIERIIDRLNLRYPSIDRAIYNNPPTELKLLNREKR